VLLYLAFLKIKIVDSRKEHVSGLRRLQKGMNGHAGVQKKPLKDKEEPQMT
jgi:hypothetical protein